MCLKANNSVHKAAVKRCLISRRNICRRKVAENVVQVFALVIPFKLGDFVLDGLRVAPVENRKVEIAKYGENGNIEMYGRSWFSVDFLKPRTGEGKHCLKMSCSTSRGMSRASRAAFCRPSENRRTLRPPLGKVRVSSWTAGCESSCVFTRLANGASPFVE